MSLLGKLKSSCRSKHLAMISKSAENLNGTSLSGEIWLTFLSEILFLVDGVSWLELAVSDDQTGFDIMI